MLKGYENYEKLKENALRTKRSVMNCTSAMEENFLKLQTENTGNFLCAKTNVFISKFSAKIGLYASMCTFLITCARQVQYCRYCSIPLCDQMNAVLKHSGLPRSRCFQIENTGSKLEENTGISQIMELSVVNWAIMMCTFLIIARKLGHGTQTRNLLRIFLAAY